jgi:methionyl-tRNA formyltransferase
MRMEAGLDTGPMLLQQAVPITPQTTGAKLHDTLAELGAHLILRALEENPPPQPQPPGETYAAKLTREHGRIDWSLPAETIERRIRAFDPWPGAFTYDGAHLVKILAADIVPDASGVPGQVLTDDLLIACGVAAIRPARLQLAGRTALDTASFLRGHKVPAGTRFG